MAEAPWSAAPATAEWFLTEPVPRPLRSRGHVQSYLLPFIARRRADAVGRRYDVANRVRPQLIERLIYRSEPTGDMRSDMDAILRLAVWANARHRITGVLASVHGHYVQVLEGPTEKLDALLACLRADSRHRNLVILYRRRVQTRLFPGWSMARTELPAAHVSRVKLDDGQGLTDQLVEMFRCGETRVA